jgi:hypothetical protein
MIEWGWASFFVSYFVTYFMIRLNHMVQEGPFSRKSLAKHDLLL